MDRRTLRHALLAGVVACGCLAGGSAENLVLQAQGEVDPKVLCLQMPSAFWNIAKPLSTLAAANCTATLKTGGDLSPIYTVLIMAAPSAEQARQLAIALPCVISGIGEAVASLVPFGGDSGNPAACRPEQSNRFGETGARLPVPQGVMLSFARGTCIVAVGGTNRAPVAYVEEYAQEIDQTIARDGCGKQRTGPEKSSTTILSTPKHRASYHYDLPIPQLVPVRAGVRGYEQLYDSGAGELEVAFLYIDRSRTLRERAFRTPIASLIASTDAARARFESEGKSMLLERRRLRIAYEALDALEEVVRDPKNIDPDTTGGLQVFRGSAITFRREFRLYDGGELVARSDTKDEVDLTYRVAIPVVFVPGTAGSRLNLIDPARPGDGPAIWPSALMSSIDWWRQAALDTTGAAGPQQPAITATDVFRDYAFCHPWMLEKGCIYQGWLAHMESHDYNDKPPVELPQRLFLFPYDWRLDIGVHPPALDAVVEQALVRNYNRLAPNHDREGGYDQVYDRRPGDKVILIGHSQGGLVIRAYVAAPDHAAKIENIILLGTPNLGTPKVFKAFATTGYNFEAPFISEEIGKSISNNWPAAYFQTLVTRSGALDSYLLDERGQVTDFRKAADQLSHVFCSLRGSPCQTTRPNRQLLDRAEAFHRALPNPVDKGIPTFIVGSINMPTIVAYKPGLGYSDRIDPALVEDPARTLVEGGRVTHDKVIANLTLPPEALVRDSYAVKVLGPLESINHDVAHYRLELPRYQEVLVPCGDTLVPVHSLVLPGATMIYTKDVGHGAYTETPLVQEYIDHLIAGRRPTGEPAPTCNSHPVAVPLGLSILARGGRFNLQVADARGARTGHTGDGQYESAIPGSVLDGSERNLTIALPYSNDEFRVNWTALDSQPLDLEIVACDGSRERRVIYASIPTTPNARGEVRFRAAGLGESLPLQIDRDGDGRLEATLHPTGVSTFEQPGWSLTPRMRAAVAGGVGLAITSGGLVWLYRRRIPMPAGMPRAAKARGPAARIVRYALVGGGAAVLLGGAFWLGRQNGPREAPSAPPPPAASPSPVAPPSRPAPAEAEPAEKALAPADRTRAGGGTAPGGDTPRPLAPGARRMTLDGRTIAVIYERQTDGNGVPIDTYFYATAPRPGASIPVGDQVWNRFVRQPAVGTNPGLPVVWYHSHWEWDDKGGWRNVQEQNVKPPLAAR